MGSLFDQKVPAADKRILVIAAHGDPVVWVDTVGIEMSVDQDLSIYCRLLIKIRFDPANVFTVDLPQAFAAVANLVSRHSNGRIGVILVNQPSVGCLGACRIGNGFA